MVEGEPAGVSEAELEALCETLYNDSLALIRQAALYVIDEEGEERDEPPAPLELSLVLCDDAHIRELNSEWRGIDAPTDVLSFEMEEDAGPGEGEDGMPELPVNVLGDVVISLDTAARQAAERRHALLDEARVLLVHGVLHLLGYDHEEDEEEAAEMAAAEQHLLKALGWKGQGLIALADSGDDVHGDGDGSGGSGGSRGSAVHEPEGGASTSAPAAGEQATAGADDFIRRWRTRAEAQLLALDMDGTLLDSRSRVLPSSVAAIKAALARGVTVFLATGKARPAAIKAMEAVGLAGEGLVVSSTGPGIFLQGLTAYGRGGRLIAGGQLPMDVVRAAFEFSAQHDVPVCGFLGEECVTHRMHPELEELHHRYYEPLAAVAPLEEVLAGPPLRKLLFMTHPEAVEGHLKPHWSSALEGSEAEMMQAVPDMLEVVPSGWDKWRAAQHLLEDLGVPACDLVAIGDGGNDLGLVAGAGIGVAMGNAVAEVKAAARLVVADNDSDGCRMSWVLWLRACAGRDLGAHPATMEGQQAWAVPDWWRRYQAQEGNFSSIDDGTLAFLSQNFGGLPLVLLLPVDYTMPPAATMPGVPCMAVPPAPLPDTCARQAPTQMEGQPLQQLAGMLGNTTANSEAELAELAAWLGTAPTGIQAGPPVAAPRMLPFGAIGQPLPPAPQQLPRPGPPLSVYCDASALEATAATPAIMPTQVHALPPAARPHPLADMTNRQAVGPAACDTKALRQISSKLHVAASKKIQPQLPEEEVKALVQQQLRAAEPSRAPWFRSGLQSSSNRYRGVPKATAAPVQSQFALAPAASGINAFASNAAFPGTGVYMPRA